MDFTIQLVKSLNLPGAWGLEIQYPNSWNSISEDTPFEIPFGVKKRIFILQQGYYLSITTLWNYMNNAMASHLVLLEVVMNYNSVSRKVKT